MNKPLTTEEVVIVSCLYVGWALVAITRELLVPLVALVLTLLGWRPKPPASLDTFADPSLGVAWEDEPMTWEQIKGVTEVARRRLATLEPRRFPSIPAASPVPCVPEPVSADPNNWLDTTTPKRTILQATSLAQLRSLATARGMDPAGLSKPDLIEAILDHIDDAASKGDTEALTPEQRNPSSRGRRR